MVRRGGRGFTIIELVIVVAVIGLLASVAIPKYVVYQAKARQAEPKTNLKVWYNAQSSIFGERGSYTEVIGDTGYTPSRGNRYQYIFSSACTYEVRAGLAAASTPADTCVTVDQFKYPGMPLAPAPNAGAFTYSGPSANPGNPAGLGGTCPSCSILAIAAGNIDNETNGIDTWVVATKSGVINGAACGNSETSAPAGMPFNTYNDSVCD
jgi:type IV pilus assembly protein PilA